MKVSKFIFTFIVLIFAMIGAFGIVQNFFEKRACERDIPRGKRQEIAIAPVESSNSSSRGFSSPLPGHAPVMQLKRCVEQECPISFEESSLPAKFSEAPFPEADCTQKLFTCSGEKLPFVETITYKSGQVEWLSGRQAWVSDFASHYETSRHFIARSLNGKPDYENQKLVRDAQFNVFKKDCHIQFHILVDLSRCRAALYCHDLDTDLRTHLKTYVVGVGRLDGVRRSGCLTPIGNFLLGNKVAIYKPDTVDFYQGEKQQMIRILGTRWLPLEENKLNNANGRVAFHGVPWIEHPDGDGLIEDRKIVGNYVTSGSIAFLQEDIEEIFAIVLTKNTSVEIVRDFQEATLPGIEIKAEEEFKNKVHRKKT